MRDKVKFKVDDEVVSFRHGEGIVVSIDDSLAYPVFVRFKKKDENPYSFTKDGYLLNNDKIRSLYHKGAKFHVTGEQIPKCMKKVTVYINAYRDFFGGYAYTTKGEAKDCRKDQNYLGTFEFTGEMPEEAQE